MGKSKKWKEKSLFSKISDIFFVVLIVALIIPASRKGILTGVNNVKSKIIPPKNTEKVIGQLSEADYLWQLTDVNGKTVSFNDFKDKVVFLNFWATWCGPCVGEMPEIQKFYDKFKDNPDVAFVIASSDDVQTIKRFVDNKKYTFPVFSIKSQLPNCFSHNSIPTSFLINKNGEIVLKQKNVANWSGKKMENNVKNLINAK